VHGLGLRGHEERRMAERAGGKIGSELADLSYS
jgi:hypothetical protein